METCVPERKRNIILDTVSHPHLDSEELGFDIHKRMWEADFGTIHSAIASRFKYSK